MILLSLGTCFMMSDWLLIIRIVQGKKTTCYLKLEHSLLQALSNRHIFSAKYHMQRENKNHVQNLSPEATANMPTKMPYSWKHCLFKQNNFLRGEQLTIIGWGWAKYCDLSVVSRSIIFRSRRLRQIIDLRDTDKSRYFAMTEFNNRFIIRSPSLFFKEYLQEAKQSAIFMQERSQEGEKRGFIYAWVE